MAHRNFPESCGRRSTRRIRALAESGELMADLVQREVWLFEVVNT